MRNYIKKKWGIILVTVISILVYRDWFTFKIYSYGDYVYYTRESLLSFYPFSVWTGNFGLGDFDILFWRLPQYGIYVLGSKLGLEFNVIDRSIVMWPWVFLSGLCVYILLSHYKLNERAKLIGSLVFAFNTYFLSISTQGHLLISVASCLSIFTLLFFIKLVDGNKIRYIPIVSIFLTLTTVYDLRFWYITSGFLVLYLLFKMWVHDRFSSEKIRSAAIFISIYLLYLVLNLYWVLPTVMSREAVAEGVLKRTLFGNEFLNIHYAYSLFHPFWTGLEPAWFEVQNIFWLSWILPVIALHGFIFGRRKAFIAFFGTLCVIGIFLTKQASIPFSGVYEWLFYTIPGFGAFREASKFYYIVAVSYSVLIAYFIQYLSGFSGKRSRYIVWFVMGLILVLLAWNVRPVVTREIGSLFIERHIPQDYPEFYKFVRQEDEYFRIAWFPRPTKWHNATTRNPQLSIMDMLSTEWITYKPEESIERYDRGLSSEADIGLDFLRSKSGEELLSSSSVKYLVLPISDPENADDVYPFFGRKDWEVYQSVKKISYLREVDIGTSKLKVFRVISYKPHMYIHRHDILFEDAQDNRDTKTNVISPSKYEIFFEQRRDPFLLLFSEKFSPSWEISTVNPGLLYLFSGYRDGQQSKRDEFGMNSFYIEPEKICAPKNAKCVQGEDGSYSFNMYVHYRPQLFFMLGLGVSGVFVTFLIVLLIIVGIRRRLINEKG